jgi:hypothetical protein
MRRRHRDICKRCQWFEPDALDTWVNQKGVVSPIVVIHQRNICRVGNQYNVDDNVLGYLMVALTFWSIQLFQEKIDNSLICVYRIGGGEKYGTTRDKPFL